MNILLTILSFMFSLTSIMAQVWDTTYYENGDIKHIKRNNEMLTGERLIRHYKKSNNDFDKNKPVVDTMFKNNLYYQEDWEYYEGSTRIFLHDSASVWVKTRFTKNGSNQDSIFSSIKGEYCFYFPKINHLEITIIYSADTTIRYFNTRTIDPEKHYSTKQSILRLGLRGAKFHQGFYTNWINLEFAGLTIMFTEDNLLDKLFFWNFNDAETGIQYELYDNFFCKSYGMTKGESLKTGEWFYYHNNGNLESRGYYDIFTFYVGEMLDGVSKKVGKWEYFNEEGKLIKKELWNDDGELLEVEEW